MKDKSLPEARQAWLLEEIKKLKLSSPIAEISEKTGYSDSIVSTYLANKRLSSAEFVRKFCEVYKYDFDAVTQNLIEKIKGDTSKVVKSASAQQPQSEAVAHSNDTSVADIFADNNNNELNSDSLNDEPVNLLSILDRMTRTDQLRVLNEAQQQKNYAELIARIPKPSDAKAQQSVPENFK